MQPGVTAPIVHIVDDDEGTRTSMARMLRAAGQAVRTYASGAELLAGLRPGEAGCLVLDVQMPELTGLELQTRIGQRQDPLPIIFLTGHAKIPDSVRAIQRGAVDFLTKPVDGTVLLEAIARALAQDAADRAARARKRELRERYERLTPREREVFAHLISGQLNKQAAADLNIAERTIKLHRARIFEKLETDSMASLARIAVELGISPSTPQS
jgi:FixJ family two-component response regulator